jgi:PAS domain S-box-containing protein
MKWKPQFYRGEDERPVWRGYALAMVFTATALAVRTALSPLLGDVQPFAFFYLSVALTAWFAGLGPAIVAFLAGLLAGWSLFLQPPFSLDLANMVRMLTYTAVSGCFGALLYYARQSELAAVNNSKRVQAAKEELQQQNAVLEELAESVLDAILIVSRNGKMLFSNEQFRQMWKFPPEVLASSSDEAALKWAETQVADPVTFRQGVARAYSQPEHAVREELPMKDGRVYDRYGAPVIHKGAEYAWVWSFRDITERQRTEEQLRRNHDTFYHLIQNNPFGMYVVDADFRLRQVSLGAQKAFRKVDPLLGRNFADVLRDIWTEPFASEVLTRFRHVLETGDPYVSPSIVEHRQDIGEREAYDWRIERITLPDGRYGVVCYFYDLSERKKAEAELRRAHALIEGIAKGTEDLIAAQDSDFRYIYFNEAYEREFKRLWAQDLVVGASMVEMMARWPEEQRKAVELWRRALNGESFSITTEFGPEQEKQVYDLRFNPIYGDGRLIGAAHILRNVTERVRTQNALREAKAQLERHASELQRAVADRTAALTETVHELEAFSYSLSHDLRAPLRAMRGFSEILQAEYSSRLDDEGNMYLARIAKSAGRLDQLILDVLKYSRIVQEEIDLQPIDVEDLARQLIEESPALQPPRAEISIESPLLPVMAHEAYMMQVLSNLVYNAVKFVSAGQLPRIRIRTEMRGSLVRLSIRDNGIGIPKQAQQRMFGIFQRYHANHAYEGTGIGLAIVRKAVERMKGRAGVQSDPGEGSTFWVELATPGGGGAR